MERSPLNYPFSDFEGENPLLLPDGSEKLMRN